MITRECDVETIADFARYYAGSFVGWHGRDPKGLILPALVGRMDGDKIQLRLYNKGERGIGAGDWELHNLDSLKANIDFGRPRIGILEDGPTIVFMSQTSSREPRKGFRVREAKMYEFNGWESRGLWFKQNPYNERLDWIWDSFNPRHTGFKESLDKLYKGERIGVALTTDMGLYTLPKVLYPLVAFKRWTIGYVRSEVLIVLHPSFSDYEQEIRRITGVEVKSA